VTIDETRKKGTESTDPYCPSVGAMPTDDIPLIVEGGKEFPARRERPESNSQVKHWKQSTAGKLTYIYHSRYCQRFTFATVEKDDGKTPEPDERAYAPNSRATVHGLWKFTMLEWCFNVK